ncbi:unnamed protein product [Ectocarpus sp. CCAP 1310/34]|nr:unnamed protein product [Ectocarpus sp. CCAP 1310/34]
MYDDVKDRILFHPMLSRGTLEETLRLAEHEQRINRRSGEGIEDTRHAPVAAGVGRGGGMRIAAAAGADGGPSHEQRSAFFCQVHGANSSHNTPDCHKLRQDFLFHYNDFMAFICERDNMRGPAGDSAAAAVHRRYSNDLCLLDGDPLSTSGRHSPSKWRLRLFLTRSVNSLAESDSVSGNEIGVDSDGEVPGVPVAGMSVFDVPVVPVVNPAVTSQAPVCHTRMSTPKGGEQLQGDSGTSAGMFDAREGVASEDDVAVLGRAEQMDVDVFHHRAGRFSEPILSLTAKQQGNTLPRELGPGTTAAWPPAATAAPWPAVAAAAGGIITASPTAAAAAPWRPATAGATSSSPSHTAGGAPWTAAAAAALPDPRMTATRTTAAPLPTAVITAAPMPSPPTSEADEPLAPSPGAAKLPGPRTPAARSAAAANSSSQQHFAEEGAGELRGDELGDGEMKGDGEQHVREGCMWETKSNLLGVAPRHSVWARSAPRIARRHRV